MQPLYASDVPMKIRILAVTNLHSPESNCTSKKCTYDPPFSSPRNKGKKKICLSHVTSEIRTYTQHKNKHGLSHTNMNKQDPRSALSLSIAIAYKTKINLKTQNKKKKKKVSDQP
jgi:hypothetical protein